MKNKLRRIVVLDKRFFWNFKDKILREDENKSRTAQSILTFFSIENRKSKITITFETWEDPYAGNPLNTGVGESISEGEVINLNYPGIVSEIIEYLNVNKIWSDENLKPINIEGLEILKKLGYKIEKLRPQRD